MGKVSEKWEAYLGKEAFPYWQRSHDPLPHYVKCSVLMTIDMDTVQLSFNTSKCQWALYFKQKKNIVIVTTLVINRFHGILIFGIPEQVYIIPLLLYNAFVDKGEVWHMSLIRLHVPVCRSIMKQLCCGQLILTTLRHAYSSLLTSNWFLLRSPLLRCSTHLASLLSLLLLFP